MCVQQLHVFGCVLTKNVTGREFLKLSLLADLIFMVRVADPVHFRPDPGPANQNFKNPDPDPTGTYQESIQTSNFFYHINQISSDI